MMNTMIGIGEGLDNRAKEVREIFDSEERMEEEFGGILSDDSTVAEVIGVILGAMYDFPMDLLGKTITELDEEGLVENGDFMEPMRKRIEELIDQGEYVIYENKNKK